MADLCVPYTFGGLTINSQTETADRLVLPADGITGLDGRPIRRQIDPRGQTDGGLVFTAYFGPRIITFKGYIIIGSMDWPGSVTPAWADKVMDLEDATISTLQGLLNTPTALTWTQSNGTSGSVTCVYGTEGGEIQFGGEMATPTFQFTLVEASAVI